MAVKATKLKSRFILFRFLVHLIFAKIRKKWEVKEDKEVKEIKGRKFFRNNPNFFVTLSSPMAK